MALFKKTILSILNNLKINQDIEDKPKEPKKHTTKEISNLIVYGYIQLIDVNKSFVPDLIPIIVAYYGLYCNPGWKRMSIQDIKALKTRDEIDYRLKCGYWIEATVQDITEDRLILTYWIHSAKSMDKYRSWINFENNYNRIAPKYTFTSGRRSPEYYPWKGHHIQINPGLAHPGWKSGKIIRRDKWCNSRSRQVYIRYKHAKRYWYYWTNVDDEMEFKKPDREDE